MPQEAGLIQIVDPGADRPMLEAKTVQCCHCGRHFTMVRGSGRERGYCFRCHGIFCGRGCRKCVPIEQQIENIERGLPLTFRPIRLSVIGLPPIDES